MPENNSKQLLPIQHAQRRTSPRPIQPAKNQIASVSAGYPTQQISAQARMKPAIMSAPPAYRPQPLASQCKPNDVPQAVARPAPPPAYRPQQSAALPRRVPAFSPAPPVYRPQPLVSQPRLKIAAQAATRPAPPPAYHPRQMSAQARMGAPIQLSSLPNRSLPVSTAVPHDRRVPGLIHSTQPAMGARVPGVIQQCCLTDALKSCWSSMPCVKGSSTVVPDEDQVELVPKEQTKSEPSSIKPSSFKGKTLTLSQENTGIAQAGDRISNISVTSCGLVLGFGSEGIAAFHWPFMTDSSKYHLIFSSLIGRIGTLKKIAVYTSPTVQSSLDDYKKTTQSIYAKHEVPTTHYLYGNNLRGEDVTVILNETGDGVDSSIPAVTSTLLSLP